MDNEINVTFDLSDDKNFDCVFSIDATTFDYTALDNKPKINNVTVEGSKTGEDYNLASNDSFVILQGDVINEISRAKDAEEKLAKEITYEANQREVADEALQEQITSNANNFDNYRTKADQDTIDNKQNDDIVNLTNSINAEGLSRKEADNNLQEQITANANNFSNYRTSADQDVIDNQLAGEITREADNREKADEALQEQITANTNNFANYRTKDQQNAIDQTKQDVIDDLSDIRDNALAGKQASETISTYGNIVTHNAEEFQQKLTEGNSITIKNNVIGVDEKLTMQVANNTQRISDIELFKFPNANIVGEPKIVSGNVSRFTSTDYMIFPFVVDVKNKKFRFEFCYATAEDVTTQQNIIDSKYGLAIAVQGGHWVVAASSNGTSWDIGVATGTYDVQPNTTYHVRAYWDLQTYKLDVSTEEGEWINDITTPSTLGLHPTTIYIGGSPNIFGEGSAHPALGTINMNHCYLYIADLLVWQGMDDAGLSTRADVSLSNLDELGEKRFADKQDVIDDLQTIREGATLGSTAIQNTDDCVHKDGTEVISGVKTFSGGTASNNNTPSIKANNAVISGTESTIGYTGFYNHRKCQGDSNIINTAGFMVNGDGSAKFLHKRGTSSAIGVDDDSYIAFNQKKFVYSTSKNSADEKDVFHAGNNYTKDQIDSLLNAKQDVLTFDSTPTAGSTNPVTSEGIRGQLDVKANATDVTTLADEVTDLSGRVTTNEADIMLKQDVLVSGTNIKTINSQSLLGSGNITIKSAPDLDDKTITKNSSEQLQAIGVMDNSDNSTALKTWTGTRAQYDAITTKDSNTLYNITDDSDVSVPILQALYPVGSLYITTNSSCPLAALFGTWEKVDQQKDNCVIETGTVNGISYRIWQDGYCEQRGVANYPQLGELAVGDTSISFAKAFNDTSYDVQATIITDGGNSWYIKICSIGKERQTMSVSFANVLKSINSTNGQFNWIASGYLASDQYTPKTSVYNIFRRTA